MSGSLPPELVVQLATTTVNAMAGRGISSADALAVLNEAAGRLLAVMAVDAGDLERRLTRNATTVEAIARGYWRDKQDL